MISRKYKKRTHIRKLNMNSNKCVRLINYLKTIQNIIGVHLIYINEINNNKFVEIIVKRKVKMFNTNTRLYEEVISYPHILLTTSYYNSVKDWSNFIITKDNDNNEVLEQVSIGEKTALNI